MQITDYLWKDTNGNEWTIESMVSQFSDKEIVLNPFTLSEEGERNFIDGFVTEIESIPQMKPVYDYYKDCESPSPWHSPWLYAYHNEWFKADMSATEMGMAWARHIWEEVYNEFSCTDEEDI